MFEDVDPENASLEDFEPLRVYLTDVANEVCETEMKVGSHWGLYRQSFFR